MAQRGMNTMSEALSGIAATCAEAMAYPDADVEFLSQVQAMCIGKLRENDPSIPTNQPSPPGLLTGMAPGGQVPSFPTPSPGAPGLPTGIPGGGTIGPMGATSELSRLG